MKRTKTDPRVLRDIIAGIAQIDQLGAAMAADDPGADRDARRLLLYLATDGTRAQIATAIYAIRRHAERALRRECLAAERERRAAEEAERGERPTWWGRIAAFFMRGA